MDIRNRRRTSVRHWPGPLVVTSNRGAVLFVGLILLIVMTIVGVSAMRGTALEERMTGNLKDKNDAFQAAEAGLQVALSAIADLPLPPPTGKWGNDSPTDACKIIDANTACTAYDTAIGVWLTPSTTTTLAGTLFEDFTTAPLGNSTEDLRQPRIIIEHRYIPPLNVEEAAQGLGVHFYRVTAVALGPSLQSRVVLETTIPKVYAW